MRRSSQSKATTILLAESNPQIRSAVRSILLHNEFRNITEASDYKSFIEIPRTTSFGLILLDSGMANLDPVAVTRLIRAGKLGLNRHAAIILLAQRSEVTFVFEAREAGVTEFIAKPFSTAVLMKRLLNAIEKPRTLLESEPNPATRQATAEPPEGDFILLSRGNA